jgi:hypothetical protein
MWFYGCSLSQPLRKEQSFVVSKKCLGGQGGLGEVFGFKRQFTYKRNIETRLSNCCCSGKAISILCSGCASVALVIHHAKRMRHIVSVLSHKRHDFLRKKKLLNMRYMFRFSVHLLAEPFFMLRRT